MKKTLSVILLSLFALSAFSAEYRVQKVKVLGPMKHKVIFQSTDLKKVRGSNVLKGKLVAQWGLHVFEVVTGFYTCNQRNSCKLTDYERVATFEKCIVKSKKRVECRKRLGGNSYSGSNAGDVIVYDDPDSVRDDYNGNRDSYDNYSEFPVRVDGEFDDVTF
ncbi:MAG: hypothetical protein ACLGHN_09055 [Bacteriovoracia bacterium]